MRYRFLCAGARQRISMPLSTTTTLLSSWCRGCVEVPAGGFIEAPELRPATQSPDRDGHCENCPPASLRFDLPFFHSSSSLGSSVTIPRPGRQFHCFYGSCFVFFQSPIYAAADGKMVSAPIIRNSVTSSFTFVQPILRFATFLSSILSKKNLLENLVRQ